MVPPSYMDLKKARQRERKALREAESALNRIGVNVSDQAQRIFDALSKTMNCEWSGDSIIAFDMIVVKPPYAKSDCSIMENVEGNSERALVQVQRVLEGEARKLS